MSGGDRCETVVLSVLAFFAALRWILEFLVTEERLFASRPNKVPRTIDAADRLVFKLRLGVRGNRHLYRSSVEIAVRHSRKFAVHSNLADPCVTFKVYCLSQRVVSLSQRTNALAWTHNTVVGDVGRHVKIVERGVKRGQRKYITNC